MVRSVVLQMVVGDVHGGGDGRHGCRRSEQGADELPAFAVGAVDGRGQLHVHGQEHGRVEEPPSSGGRHARHERARGAGPGRGRVRPVRVVHVHHFHRRRHREYRRNVLTGHNRRTTVVACPNTSFPVVTFVTAFVFIAPFAHWHVVIEGTRGQMVRIA